MRRGKLQLFCRFYGSLEEISKKLHKVRKEVIESKGEIIKLAEESFSKAKEEHADRKSKKEKKQNRSKGVTDSFFSESFLEWYYNDDDSE